jgi:hypothetical protein
MTKKPILDLYMQWLTKNLDLLLEKIQQATSKDDFADFDWPVKYVPTHEDDLVLTANQLCKKWGDKLSYCGLLGAEQKLYAKPYDINYFFIRMHLLGHFILTDIEPSFDMEKMTDIAIVETTSLFFASVACHRYFSIDLMTPYMAKQIASSLYDNVQIANQHGSTHSSKFRAELCSRMVAELIESEQSLLQ